MDWFSVDYARAATGARTRDLFVTNEMLYQLSYCGLVRTALADAVQNY